MSELHRHHSHRRHLRHQTPHRYGSLRVLPTVLLVVSYTPAYSSHLTRYHGRYCLVALSPLPPLTTILLIDILLTAVFDTQSYASHVTKGGYIPCTTSQCF